MVKGMTASDKMRKAQEEAYSALERLKDVIYVLHVCRNRVGNSSDHLRCADALDHLDAICAYLEGK